MDHGWGTGGVEGKGSGVGELVKNLKLIVNNFFYLVPVD